MIMFLTIVKGQHWCGTLFAQQAKHARTNTKTCSLWIFSTYIVETFFTLNTHLMKKGVKKQTEINWSQYITVDI